MAIIKLKETVSNQLLIVFFLRIIVMPKGQRMIKNVYITDKVCEKNDKITKFERYCRNNDRFAKMLINR